MKLKRLVAFFLVMTMTIGVLPSLVFADENDGAPNETKVVESSEPEEKKPAKPAETKPQETKPAETKPSETTVKETEKPEDTKPAETTAAETTKPESTEPAEPSETEKEIPETTEPAETREKAPVETGDERTAKSGKSDETEPEDKEDDEKEITITVESRTQTYVPSDKSDNKELFRQYIERKLSVSKRNSATNARRTAKSALSGNALTGNDKKLYDSLKKQITLVAEGSLTSTALKIPISEFGFSNETVFTAEQLGFESLIQDGKAVEGLQAAIDAMYYCDWDKVLDALLADCPYELYWFDKTASLTHTAQLGYNCTVESEQVTVAWLSTAFSVYFPVANPYSAGNYQTNPSEINRANTAISNASSIVSSANNKSDYEKLVYYINEICKRVVYDEAAVQNGSESNMDPWQLIYVFDNDENTNVVCEGYSKAFKYLCDLTEFKNDISCILVVGTMTTPNVKGPHMWNLVTMDDGKNYLVDVTHCDAGSTGDPSWMFLRGYKSGSVSSGYTCYLGSTPFLYEYDDENNAFSTAQLTISDKDYYLVSQPEITTWTDLQKALNQGGNIKLTKDITAGTGDTQLYINKTVVLDLNGHIINRNLKTAADGGGVIFVDEPGNLTITDSRPDATHSPAITYKDLKTGNDVTVKGGIITGGYNTSGAGGIYFKWSSGTINGGTIVGNKACGTDVYGNAGGLVIRSSTVTMNGGAICGNEAVYGNGETVVGGVFLNDLQGSVTVFNINGGLITGNYTNSTEGSCLGGVHTYAGKINISGNPQIYGNMKNGMNQNMIMSNTAKGRVIDITGALTNGAEIGVTTWRIPTFYYSPEAFTDGFGTYNKNEHPSKYFTLDDDKAIMVFDDSGEAKVALKFKLTITTDGNGTVTLAPSDTDIYYYLHPTVTATPNTGYVFKEWQVLSGKATIDKNNKISVDAEDADNPVTDIKIKAVFEKQTFTVTFADGTSTISTASVIYGETVTKPSDPVKNGYRFDNWYADSAFNTIFDFANTKIEKNTTVYAKFSQKFNVTFVDGTNTLNTVTVFEGETVTKPSDPVKDGYRFDNWYADSAFNTIFDFANTKIEKNTTIYAKFSQKFNVLFVDGTTTLSTVDVFEGEKVSKPSDPVKDGYSFIDWYSDPKFENEFDFDSAICKETTIYARFLQEFDIAVISGEADKTKAFESEEVKVTAGTAPTGYVFDKWESVTGTVVFADPNSEETTFNMPASNVEVKATYKIVSGNCGENGDNLTWKIDYSTGTLTISGTGNMANWGNTDAVPWYPVRDSIKSVVIADGVTSIGDRAFLGYSNITSVTIPGTITSIGYWAFNKCTGIESVVLPEGTTTINAGAFSGCTGLTSVTIPGSVTTIGDNVFNGCTSLTDVTYTGTKENWNSVSIGSGNESLVNANMQFAKSDNTLSVKGKTAKVKYSKLRKKKQTLTVGKVIAFTNRGQGTLTYIKVSGSKKVSINKTTGKVTIKKKGLKKKKTYSIRVKVMASGNENYNASTWKYVTFKIKVK